MANKIELILQLLDQSGPGFKGVQGHLKDLQKGVKETASGFGSLKNAIMAAAGSLVLKKLLDELITYNKTLETSKLGIAAIITSMATVTDAQGRVLEGQEKFNAAQKLAVEAQKELQKIAMSTPATYTELVEVFQGILAPAMSAKMEFKDILSITGLLTNATKAIGLQTNQIKQEARDLIQGGIQPASSSLAVALGINDAMVKKWREQGTLAKELNERLKGFVYASREFGDTWEGAWSNFKDIMERAIGEGGRAVFEALKKQLKDISNAFVNIKYDANGAVSAIEIKPEVLYRLRAFADILAEMVGLLKEIASWGAKAMGALWRLNPDMREGFAKRQWAKVQKGVEGVPLSEATPDNLQDLLEKGWGADEIAKGIAAGKITVGTRTERARGRAYGFDRSQLEFGEKTPDDVRQELEQLGSQKFTIKPGGSGSTTDDAKAKKTADATEKLKAQIYELEGLEEKLIDLQAQRYRDEGIDKHLVNQWQDLQYKKLQYAEEEKLNAAREQWTKADLDRAQAYIDIKKGEAEVDAEIETRRDRLAVDRGELTVAEQVNREYDRKVAYLTQAKDGLQELFNGMGIEVEYSAEAQALAQKLIALQAEINKLLKERGIVIKENTEAQRKEILETLGTHAQEYAFLKKQKIDSDAAKMKKNPDFNPTGVDRWKEDEYKKIDVQTAEAQIKSAGTVQEAVAAKWKLMVLEAKTSGEQIAQVFEENFNDVKATISDLIMDSIEGFENWASIVESLLKRVLQRWIDMQIDAAFGLGGGSSGGSWVSAAASFVGSLFGSSSSAGTSDMTSGWGTSGIDASVNNGPAFHRGGKVIKLHVGGYGLKSNEVRAILEEDEYVVRKEAARALGPAALNIINQGQIPGTGGLSVAFSANFGNGKIASRDISDLRRTIEDVCDTWAQKRL